MRMTEEQFAEIQRKNQAKPQTAMQKMQALGRLKAGVMNQTEQRYADYLESEKHAGEVLWYGFEAMTFKLADNTRYTPDFMVLRADGLLEAREVKGFWKDDARVKIKVAAALFPIKFVAVTAGKKSDGGGWLIEEF